MSISDKTRKLLWGSSGNRCSYCKLELVIKSNGNDTHTIVGEECHIVSGQVKGPRYESDFPRESLDSYNNLILLCSVHHKMVDDQCDKYTKNKLLEMKESHEKWVKEQLSHEKKDIPPRLKRVKENIPSMLMRVYSGKELIQIVDGAMGYQFDYDEPNNENDAELISGFLQFLQDFGYLSSDFEAGERVRYSFELTRTVEELAEHGFFVFGGREVRILEGGRGNPASFPIAIVYIRHKDNEEIIKVDLSNQQSDEQQF